jgi:hypothetical protein
MISFDAGCSMAETLIFALRCVDCLSHQGLRTVTMAVLTVLQVLCLGVRRFVVCNPLSVCLLRRTPYRLG